MTNFTNHQAPNEKEILEHFLKHEGIRKLKASFGQMLGNPIWWVATKIEGSSHLFRSMHDPAEAYHDAWKDPRLQKFRASGKIFSVLRQHAHETQPFLFEAPATLANFCVPLKLGSREIGFFLVSGVKKNINPQTLDLLGGYVSLLLESSVKTEEVNRLAATLRPRAIALSTVHTVHRIINSTLNLDELVSRLGHLTAQVLRVERCTIYLVEKNSPSSRNKTKSLICKARVGFPKNKNFPERILFGSGLEGRVAKTAEFMLRKRFICVPLIDEDVMGVVTIRDKKDRKDFSYSDLEIVTTLAEEAVIAIKNAQSYEEQRRVTLSTIQSLAVILGGHSHTSSRISQDLFLRLAQQIAHDIRLTDDDSQALHYAVLLKDTAKVGIPEEILKKSEKLTGDEFAMLREHPIKGAKIVQHFENLKSVAPIILYSREKYDGSGYPKGLKGEKIPIGARILGVLNAFDAIFSGRPYRNQASVEEALDEIVRNRGTQFDPRIVDAFVKIVEKGGFRRFLRDKT